MDSSKKILKKVTKKMGKKCPALPLRRSTRKVSKLVKVETKSKKSKASKKACVKSPVPESRSKESEVKLFDINDYPAEIISKIADFANVSDRLSLQDAYPQSIVFDAVKANLALVKALYLMMDEYDYLPGIQYGFLVEDNFKPSLLPSLSDFEGNEAKFVLDQETIKKFSFADLKETFPSVRSLKIVIRKPDSFWILKACRIIARFSKQLVALQILITNISRPFFDCEVEFSPTSSPILELFNRLETLPFPQLKHLTLHLNSVFTGQNVNKFKLPNLLGAQVEEVYLRLPFLYLLFNLSYLQANKSLKKFGFIIPTTSYSSDSLSELEQSILRFDPAFSAKITHMIVENFFECIWNNITEQLPRFPALTHFKYTTDLSNGAYLKILSLLENSKNLKHVFFYFKYGWNPAFECDSFKLIRVPSVTSATLSFCDLGISPQPSSINFFAFNTLLADKHFVNCKLFNVNVHS